MASLSQNPYIRSKRALKGKKMNGLEAHEMAKKSAKRMDAFDGISGLKKKRKAGKTVGGPNVKRKRSKKAGATVGGPNVKRKRAKKAGATVGGPNVKRKGAIPGGSKKAFGLAL